MLTEPNSNDVSGRSRSNRVPRACDRCRIRKIKCNGKNQCNRCFSDDAICVYTKRRRPSDKAYSKEYVQLLEEQQSMLIRGVKELYRRSRAGEQLPELQNSTNDQSLIHDILACLDIINDNKEDPDNDMASPAYVYPMSRESSASGLSLQIPCFEVVPVPPLSHSPQSTPSTLSPSLPNIPEFDTSLDAFNAPEYQSFPPFLDSTPKLIEYTMFREAREDLYTFGRHVISAVPQSQAMPLCIDPRRTSYSTVSPASRHAYTT